ncbi:MAG: hypothetical protein ACFFAS_14880 [Promethearchaeota archaeon]
MIFDYYDSVEDGIEYLMALGSIIGILGFIVCLIFFLFGGKRIRTTMLTALIVCIILISICGFDTGLNYFHINV